MTSERIGARPWLAHTQDDYAHMLLRRGEPDDAEHAGCLLDCARTACRELGMSAHVPTSSSVLAANSPL